MDLEDFVRSGNQGVDPALYDVENAAIDRSEILWTALQELATWVDLVLLDLGCGSGFWRRPRGPRRAAAAALPGRSRGHRRRTGRQPSRPGPGPPWRGAGVARLCRAHPWWASNGATSTPVMSSWEFDTLADLEAVLHLEFPAEVAQAWLHAHPDRTSLSYGYLLHTWSPGPNR